MLKLLTIFACLFLFDQPLKAKYEAPNYNLIVESFSDFYPGKKLEDVEKAYGKGEITDDKGEVQTKKFLVSKNGLSFPVLVQFKESVVTDFFIKFASSFPHNDFHKAFLKNLGPQSSYKPGNGDALYTWEKAPLKHTYSAACTITCFPIFYSVQKMEHVDPSILEKMK
jgi:hypothetical protein